MVTSHLPSRLKWNFYHKINQLDQPRKEDMSYQAILEYIFTLSKIYFQSSKKEKNSLLNHAGQITGYNRKSLIRKLQKSKELENKKKRCGAKTKYPPELLKPHIEYLWTCMGQMSPKKMKAAYPDWLPFYHENDVTNHIKYLLEKMSASTLGRFIKKNKILEQKKIRGLTSTSPARHMQNKVPINTLDSKITKVGYVQSDTVAHCGARLEGEFINSVTLTDIFSTWTVNRAIFAKKGPTVRKAMSHIMQIIPFKVIAINTDSGSEFLNVSVFNEFQSKKIIFTRSRPYKKNDNCYVEQKNYTHTRELFGYQRLDDIALVRLMNDIYDGYWNPLLNFFTPTFKLKEKIRIGAKIKKKYDKPQTPYQRLMESKILTEQGEMDLAAIKKALNPFELRRELDRKLEHFFKVVTELEKLKKRDLE